MVKYALYPGPRPYILTSLTLSPTDLMCGLLLGSPVACSRSAAVKSSIWAVISSTSSSRSELSHLSYSGVVL